ncbi:uncharacterized protein LOC143052971 [Mytilus galloprovincialis]|uniref:uncharacterized protein LOC143052971 n=1 Tax=Mytilus galloprovincialis TaxID=29158 RepID=UPI003F7BF883
MSGKALFSLIILNLVLCTVAANVRCFKCAGVPKIEDCSNTITCGDNEECFVRKSVGAVGNTLVESGCMSTNVCKLISSGKRSTEMNKRASVGCFQCCNSDFCNKHLCTSQPLHANHLECFSCNDVLKPEHCTQTYVCGREQECYSEMRLLSTNYEKRYSLGCTSKVLCRALEADAGSGGGNYCSKCCHDSYCNTKLCGLLNNAKPLMTVKPQDRNALPGDKIELQCLVAHIDGVPFNITWTHQNSNNNVSTPPVQLTRESQILDMTITSQHYGYWTCSARNQNGVVNATALIKPPVPSG